MSIEVAVAAHGTRVPIARARVAAIAERVLRAERAHHARVSIAFVSDGAIAALNRRHLGRRGATDVIAFAFEPAGVRSPVAGDIYIAPAVARRQARRLGRSVREELARLVIHGTLHVLGYDHPDGEDRTTSAMWRRQERLLVRALDGRR